MKLGVRGEPGQTFHITSSSLVPSSTVIGWIEAPGAKLRRVPFPEWKEKMRALPKTHPDNPLAAMAWTFVEPNTDDLSWQELYTIGVRPYFETVQSVETLGDPSLLRAMSKKSMTVAWMPYFLRVSFREAAGNGVPQPLLPANLSRYPPALQCNPINRSTALRN